MSAVRQVGIKMVVDAQSVTTELPRAAREFVNLGASAEQGATRATRSLAQVSMSVRDIVQGAAGLHIVSNGIEAISNAITSLPRNAFDYSKNLEVSQVGMAGILGSMTAINGQQLDYNRGLQLAVQYIHQLNDDALRTAATSQELVQVFQALLAPGLGARMTLDEIRQLTVVGTNAVKSMGLDASQVVQELRDLVAGGIQPASSTLANALGLKDSDIAKAKASSEGLFAFLMSRLQGFEESSNAFGDTFKGRLDQIREGATRVAAEGMEPLITASKAALGEVSSLFSTIDANQKVTLNEDLVAGIRELSEMAVTGVGALRELGVGLYEHLEAVTMLASAYMGMKLGNFVADMARATVAKVEAAQASRLAAVQSAAESAGNVEVALTSKQKLAAYLAELSAKAAQAQADVAAQAAQLATLNTTREAIVVARAEVVAKMDAVRATMAQAEAQIAAARAAGAQSIALAAVREGTQALSAAQARHAVLMAELATLGKQQAGVQAAIAAATTAQTAAQNAASASAAQLAAAQGAASVAGRALSGVAGFLGGPIGIVTTAVTLGATAWALWGSKGSDAERQVQGAVARTTPEIIADLDKQIVKLQQRNALAAAGMGDLAKQSGEATDRLAELQAQIDNLQAGKGPTGGQGLPEEARRELLQKLLVQYGTLAGKIRSAEEAQTSLTTGAGKLGLTVQGAEQAWRKANDGVKTAIAIQQEYSDKLSASRSAWEQYRTALEQQGTDPEKLRQAQAEQDQVERQLAAERDKKIKDLGAGAATARAQGIDAEIAATKHGYKLLAAQTADSLAEVDALRKRGAIDESEALERRTALQLADIDAQRAALQAELALLQGRKDSAKEQANIQGELAELAQRRANTEAQAARQQQELDAQAADALEQRIEGYERAAQQAQESLRTAKLDTLEIGKTGAALGALRQARVEDAAAELERQAATMDGIDWTGRASKALREQAQAIRDLAKVQGYAESARMVHDYAKAIDEANAVTQFELSLTTLSQREREIALEQYRIAIDLKKRLEEIDARNPADSAGAAKLKAEATEAAARAQAAVASRVYVRETTRTVDQINDIFRQGFADMLNRGEEAWDAFGKSLVTTFKTTVANEVYKTFAEPFVVNIIANLIGFMGSGGGNAMQAASGADNLLTAGRTAMNLMQGGFNIAAHAGQSLATSELIARYGGEAVQEMLGQFGAGMMNTSSWGAASQAFQAGGAQMAGVIAGSLLNGFAGYGISRLISGGYQVNKWVDRIGGIASAIPGIGPIAGVISGVVNRLFGRKLKDSGIEGEFGGETGFEGRAFQYYKGGLLRSSKTKYSDLDEEIRQGLADQFNAMRFSTANMAQVLGLGTESIDDFTARVKISLHGLSAEDAQKRIQEEFDKIAEQLASVTLGTTEYTREGETAVEALTRLSSTLAGVNSVLETLDGRLYEASLAGADMASSLADLFGGMDGFNTAANAYFRDYYSQDEQREAARKELDRALESFDISMPDLNADNALQQYRALVDAQDKNTEEGRKAWAALVQLSGAFKQLTESAEDAARAQEQAAKAQEEAAERRAKAEADARKAATDAAWATLQKSIQAARDAAQAEVALREERLATARAVVDIARDQARDLRGLVDSTVAMTAAQANAWIDNALTASRSGTLPDAEGLRQAITDARAGMGTSAYSSRLDYEAAQMVLANKLDTIGDSGQAQVDVNELLLEQARIEIDRLDTISRLGREALDAARGNTVAVRDVESAVREFYARMFVETGKDAGGGASGGSGGGGGFVSGPGGGSEGGTYDRDADIRWRIDQQLQYAAERGLGHDDASTLQHINAALYGSGISNADIARVYEMPEDYIDSLFEGIGIKRFASGGAFTNGVVARPTFFDIGQMGEAGEEAILPLANVGGRLGVHALGGKGEAQTVAALRQLAQQQYDLLRAVIVRLDSIETLARKQDAIGVLQRETA